MSERSYSHRGSSHSSDRSGNDAQRRKSDGSSRRQSRSSSRSRSGSDDSQKSKRRDRSGSLDSQSYSSSRYNRRMGGGGGGKYMGVERQSKMNRRVLSAGRLKVNELRNKVSELSSLVNQLKEENRLMRRQQIRQEKKLGQYESVENDMPTLLQRQNGEMHMLREQLRKQKEKLSTKEKKLRKTEEDLERSSRLLKKMKALVDDKKLSEREELANKLEKSNKELTEKDELIKRLEKHIENLNKNHKHEFGIEHARQKEAHRNLEQVKFEIEKLQIQLREREKELAMRGIYVQRQSSIGGGPLSSGSASRPPQHLPRDSLSPQSNHEFDVEPGQQASSKNTIAVGVKRRGKLTQNQRQQQMNGPGSRLSSETSLQPQQKQLQKNFNGLNTAAADIPAARKPPVKSTATAADIPSAPAGKPPVKPTAAAKNRRAVAQQKLQQNESSAAAGLDQELQQEQDAEKKRREKEIKRIKEERERAEKLEKEANERKKKELDKVLKEEEVRKFDVDFEDEEDRRVEDSLISKLNNLSTNGNGNTTNHSLTLSNQQGARNKVVETFGGYKPSFLGGPSGSQASQNIMDELFGDGAEKKDQRNSPQLVDNFGFLEAGDGNNRVLPLRKREQAATLANQALSRNGSDEIVKDFLI